MKGFSTENPIIAAVRDVKHMNHVIQTSIDTIFLMTGDIFTIEECVSIARNNDKQIFIHVDLIRGIAKDKEGIKYLARRVKPDGIVTTKNQLIHVAKKEGLLTVQHLFLIDTHAYQTGIKNILDVEPDAVELMPGLMPRVINDLYRQIPCPIVCAGLIKSEQEVIEALGAGAAATAISEQSLWDLQPQLLKK
ncbi:glycerol-3-phosphate responsive antiterminator [Bacillus gobiensis]|uniref:glycerol-3-phosphate responsive antiterminator n=1 Tax=Bacillus gobiensis TaxID=1441095 RepID=UPI003D259CA2